MKMIRNILLFSILFFLSKSAGAQSVSQQIDELMELNRGKKSMTVDDVEILKSPPAEILNALQEYAGDPDDNVRLIKTMLEIKTAREYPSENVKEEVVERLTEKLSDPLAAIWQQAAKALQQFESEDFSRTAKKNISDLLEEETPKREAILLAGVAQMSGEKKRLREIIADSARLDPVGRVGKWYGTFTWHAFLALARLGETDAIEKVLQQAPTEPDEVIRVSRVSRDVAFIRQPGSIKYLESILDTDARLPTTREGSPGNLHAQYAMELLAQSLENFPVQQKGFGYTKEDIETARQWMDQQSEYAIRK
ncbi:MAG: hypothetical protein WD077_02195 [Bacteroidia bacterium]